MFYKNLLLISIFCVFANCSTNNLNVNPLNKKLNNNFTNRGFALIYDNNLYADKSISKKIDERSLVIFNKYLKKNTQVKITNILNNKSLIAKVGNRSDYPNFYNSVISIRIASVLEIDKNEPYIEIKAIEENFLFIAKKAKTYDEEKKIANKVPVTGISIDNLNIEKNKVKKNSKKNFSYIIKIADFYFNETATSLVKRIKTQTRVDSLRIRKLTENKYRVYIGPIDNINSLQKSFNDIEILKFENIEIIKND